MIKFNDLVQRLGMFLKERTLGYWFLLASTLLGVVSIIGFATFESNLFTSFPAELLIMLIAGVVTDVILLIKPIPFCEYIPLIFYGLAFMIFLDTQSFFISNVFVGIDGNTFSGAFMTCLIGDVMAMSGGMIACILNPGKVKESE